MLKENTVTLEQVLESREERARRQSELLAEYKCPLISFTPVMPGSSKKNQMSKQIFSEGNKAIESGLSGCKVNHFEARENITGYEAFYSVDLPILTLKKIAVEIEDNNRHGRLFDIDVIGLDGKPVSRSMFGLGERRCLICGDSAHACSRSKKHSVEELLKEIERQLKYE